MSIQKVALALFASVLLPAAAFAVDGTVLINQAAVNNAGGFPFHIAQSGSYKLSGNLVAPQNYDGISITADHVTLDLNGFTISGSGSNNYGVNGHYNSYVNVSNGQVSGFATGVRLSGNGETVSGITANGYSLTGVDIGSGIISNSDADGNGWIGLEIDINGAVQHCRAANNSLVGIYAAYGSALITDNQITGGQEGIEVYGGNASVTNNFISNATATGLVAYGTVGYGLNTFAGNASDVTGGTSMQNNVCSNGSKC